MHETAPLPPNEAPPAPSPFTASLPSCPPVLPPSRLARGVRILLAVPRALARRPGRSSAATGLLLHRFRDCGRRRLAVGFPPPAGRDRRPGTLSPRRRAASAGRFLDPPRHRHPRNAPARRRAASRPSGSFDEADGFLNQYQEVRGKDDEDLMIECAFSSAPNAAKSRA